LEAIHIEKLVKEYPSGWPGRPHITALRGLSLSVGRGEIYGFLGPNGAGKTTTLKILMGLIRATAGRAELLGMPAGEVKVRQKIGFLPESPYFYDYLTAKEFLCFYGNLAGLSHHDMSRRVPELLAVVGLSEASNRQLRKFSKGMLQRIGLAQALIHDPDVVILDEPMSGLDPIGRRQVRDLILKLRDQEKTVFFSTHIIPDVEMICDRVGIIVKGKLIASGRVEELVSHGHTQSVEVVCEGLTGDQLSKINGLSTRILQQAKRFLIVLPTPDKLEEVITILRSHGGRLISVSPQKGSLEDLFVHHLDT
jgi:ABC-2 type transport system ATP-binding protein